MGEHADADKKLQERLNALKPAGTVSLAPTPRYTAADTIERSKPPTRDDALSNRLKNLREQADPPKAAASRVSSEKQVTSIQENETPPAESQPTRATAGDGDVGSASSPSDNDQDVDPLLQTDDQTLEELLAELESDQPWLEEVAAEQEEHQRVMALLDEISKASIKDEDPSDDQEKRGGSAKDGHQKDKHNDEDDDDDNSDGEKMTGEVEKVLARAMDGMDLDEANKQHSPSEDNAGKIGPPTSKSRSTPAREGEGEEENDHDDDAFAASVAARMAALKNASSPAGPGNSAESSAEGADTLLPSAPTSEPQAPVSTTEKEEADPFGLPGAPTFAPDNRPTHKVLGVGSGGAKLTDEDQRTWCTVCLEDGAIRCLDCEDPRATTQAEREAGEVYCARCWKEMHVGASAGYEERGHRWEKFVRPRVR